MPECCYRASSGGYKSGFPLGACGNDAPKVSFSFSFQYSHFYLFWDNSFLGRVDSVEIEFNGNDSVSANFEPDSENLLYIPIIFKN